MYKNFCKIKTKKYQDCNQDITANILLLGMSYTNFESYTNDSLARIIKNVKDKKISAMDGRDLIRILEVEKMFNLKCYTVSLEDFEHYSNTRHLSMNFNSESFGQQIINSFKDCIFTEIYLDYFWNPQGIWQAYHWKKKFFSKTLIDFTKMDILSEEGIIYLPFTLHCFKSICDVYENLESIYTISWIEKTSLKDVKL